jgi:hypothetical protein
MAQEDDVPVSGTNYQSGRATNYFTIWYFIAMETHELEW